MFIEKLKEIALTDSDKVAVSVGNSNLTYKDLYIRSCALANYIKDNYSSNKPIAIYGDRETDMVTGAYAALMAKKTYIMIPNVYPIERIKYILKDCEADLIYNVSEKQIEETDLPIIKNSVVSELIDKYSNATDLDVDNYNMKDNALIIYTSGSTGNPKGVQITYSNLAYYTGEANVLAKMSAYVGEGLRVVSMSSYAFIANELFLRIIPTGGTWTIVPSEALRNIKDLFDIIISSKPHLFSLTPSIATKLLELPEFRKENFPWTTNVGMGGEPLKVDLAKKVYERFPGIVSNAYGSTETCSINISYTFNPNDISEDCSYVPVGKKDESKDFIIADSNNKEITEDNVMGEALFRGKGITKGYINLLDLTSKHYFEKDGTRYFKTGDIAYYKNGLIYLAGRSDNQIKIGGNRIEIEDVEAHLSKCSIVSECAVGVSVDKNGKNSLTGLIVLNKENAEVKRIEGFLIIKKEMMRMVEGYKIPQKILFIKELPRNYSGKIDRKAVNAICNKED